MSKPFKVKEMDEYLDSFQNGLEALMSIRHRIAKGQAVLPEELQLWAAAKRFVKKFRAVAEVVLDGKKV